MYFVRVRITFIAIALLIAAFGGLRQGELRSAEPYDGPPASGQLAGQPAPDPALPAFMSVAVNGSSTARTLSASHGHRHARPTAEITVANQPAPIGSDRATSRRSFPLLI
jgi:hypothetical protein